MFCTMPILMLLVAGPISDNSSAAPVDHVGSDMCEGPRSRCERIGDHIFLYEQETMNKPPLTALSMGLGSDVDDGDQVDPRYSIEEVCTA